MESFYTSPPCPLSDLIFYDALYTSWSERGEDFERGLAPSFDRLRTGSLATHSPFSREGVKIKR
jgi:hypothetical protein